MRRLRRALVFSVARQYSVQVLQFGCVMVLSRLLSPTEIGIYSVALSVFHVVGGLQAFGVGQYIVQEKSLSRDKIRAATGVMYLVSWPLGVAIFLAAPMIADFYDEPKMTAVLLVISCIFLLSPLNGVASAHLRREMAFGKLYIVAMLASSTRVGVVVALALVGFGHMSMAWGALAGMAMSVLVLNYFRPDTVPFLPGIKEFRSVFSFGSFAAASAILNQTTHALPDFVIGRMLTMADVALFSRAWGLMGLLDRMVTAGIRPVILPYLSSLERQGESLAEPYKRATSFMTALAWPGYGFLFLMMFPIVRILYGSQWDGAVAVAQALCIWGCFSVLTAFSSDLLLARGGVRKVFLLNLINFGIRIVLIVVSVPYGLFAVSIAFVFAGLLHLFVASHMVRTLSGVTVFDLLRSSVKSFGVTCYALAIPITIVVFMDVDTDDYLLPFILALVGLVGGWMVGVFCTGHEAGDEVRRLRSSMWAWVRSS